MSKKGFGFFGCILLLIRLILTFAFTVAVFALLLGFVAFRCMYPAGSEKLAAMLSSYPIVDTLPKIYFSQAELERIISEQAEAAQEEQPVDDQTDAGAVKPDMNLAENTRASILPPDTDDHLLYVDGLYIESHPAAEAEPVAPPSDETEPESAEPTVLYGCVNGAVTTYLRLSPSLDAEKVNTIEPGTWCTVLTEEKQFYKILYENSEYYIYNDRLDLYEVPDLPEGLTVPGLPEATDEEIEKMLSGDTQQDQEEDNRIMCGYVDAITPYRTSPSFAEAQAGFLEADTHFRILDKIASFYKVSVDGTEIYVYAEKVTVYYEDLPSSTPVEAEPLNEKASDEQA